MALDNQVVLDALVASATAAGLPITYDTLAQGVVSNAQWVYQAALASGVTTSGTTADEFANSISQIYKAGTGVDYQLSATVDTSKVTSTSDPVTLTFTHTEPTTTQVYVPAVYESVPVTTVSTYQAPVTSTSYSDVRSSSVTDNAIPFMRSISVVYKGKGFKPTSTYNAFFDGIVVSSYITPATVLSVTSITNSTFVFDDSTSVGGSNEATRIVPSSITQILDTGDVVTGYTSGATGVIIGIEPAPNNTLLLYLVNVIGTFDVAEQIIGSISNSRGTISSVTIPVTLDSSTYGSLYGLFAIPNDSVHQFTTGKKKLLFSTGLATDNNADSFGGIDFISNGTLEIVQPIITTIRTNTTTLQTYTTSNTTYNSVLQSGTGTTQTVAGSTTTVVSEGVHLDPLAQSFYVAEENGIFVTGIDLFFATKDDNLPVFVSIINVVNGYPGPVEANLSRTIIPAYEVNISPNKITDSVTGRSIGASDTPTHVKFPAPVFLDGKTDYCIYLHTDSFKYNVWTSYIGENSNNGYGMIASQSTLGSLFKSQNRYTWSTDQYQDLTFKLYRAKFDTGVIGDVILKNAPLSTESIKYNALYCTSGSNTIRVLMTDHGFINGQIVDISGLSVGTYFGVPSGEINGTHTVSNCEFDYFTISSLSSATSNGNISDPSLRISKNVRVDSITPIVQELKPVGTDIKYVYGATTLSNTKNGTTTYITNNAPNDTTETFHVLSSDNESAFLSGQTSFSLNASLYSNSDFVSPQIDTQRLAILTTSNRINVPSTSINVPVIDFVSIASASSVITVNTANNSFNTSNSTLKLKFATLIVGQHITVSGCSGSGNNDNFLITAVASDGSYFIVNSTLVSETSTAISMSVGTRFKEEITPLNSSSTSKYVSRELKFANPSSAFKIFFNYNKPAAADIQFYYKVSNTFDNVVHATLPYNALSYSSPLKSSENKQDITEGSIFLEGLKNFDTLSIKIVYNSSNTNKIPRMSDLRIVALA